MIVEPKRLDRSSGGLGIGPALVRSPVDLHGGTEEDLSAAIGQGSEFLVRLPCASALRSRVVLPPEPDLPMTSATELRTLSWTALVEPVGSRVVSGRYRIARALDLVESITAGGFARARADASATSGESSPGSVG